MSNLSESQIDTVLNDRRVERRNRVFKGGTMSFNNGYGVVECVVRNQTSNGAMLMMGETTGVPARFVLKVGDSGPRHAQIRWRSPTCVGVEIT